MNAITSSWVGMKLAQPCFVTRIAPQAFARRAVLYQSQPLTKPYRKPEAKASPAPRILLTSTGKPGTSICVGGPPFETRCTVAPAAPRFCASTRGPRSSSDLDCGVDIPADTGVRDLGMRQAYLARIGQHRGIDFVVGADHDIDQAQELSAA